LLEASHWLDNWPLDWLFSKPCPLCRQPLASPGLATRLCSGCIKALLLPSRGLRGTSPLPWWAVGSYQGGFRHLLLDLRKRPQQERLAALLRQVEPPSFPAKVSPLLVSVPSWKRRGNPLPALMGQVAGKQWRWAQADLLRRSRPVLGQHHLHRALRLENQRGSFTCQRCPQGAEARQHPVLLVDDILTSGATALSAADTLRQAGWRVQGVICLARTPWSRQATSGDLRSVGVQADTPG
jgi:predicted amidophosphoribosyltransferase